MEGIRRDEMRRDNDERIGGVMAGGIFKAFF
jgi:hypothetical protein